MATASVGSVIVIKPRCGPGCIPRNSSSPGTKHSHRPNKDGWESNCHKLLGGASFRSVAMPTKHKDGKGRAAGFARAFEKRKKGPLEDLFYWGEDPDAEFGDLFSEGKQSPELPRPPTSKKNDQGYLEFPEGYNVELATLGTYIRGDVRRCLCWVHGGVYENLLFFPGIELIRNRYPGVKIDVVAGERGKQTYEMNKFINKAIVFDSDAEWTVPADLVEFLGVVRNEYYDLILSTKYAGFKHCSTLFMMGGRTRKVSYVPKYHAEWVTRRLLTEGIVARYENLAEAGYNMYEEIFDYVAQPGRGVPQEPIPVLQIGVSKRVRKVVIEKVNEAGLSQGKFVVFHGIESNSEASMTSPGDTDCLLPNKFWGQLKSKIKEFTGVQVVVVIPHEKERAKVLKECGKDVSVIYITTPGQLGALIKDSLGLVSTNTAAMLMAIALNKPSVALFGSAKKASLYVPTYAEKVKVVSSKTGKLADVDVDEACSAWRYALGGQLAIAT